MLNYIWFGMIVVGFVVGIMNGRIDEVTKAVIESSGKAIEISIGLLGVMCLWTGLMGIAEKSGLVELITKLARPILRFLFPKIPAKHPAIGAIVMNLVANFFGLGNAATPLGLKAMNELQKLNPRKDTATDEMSTFLVMNTSAIQLIPATVISIRAALGSANPTEIVGTVWVATVSSAIVGIIAVKTLGAIFRRGKQWKL